MIPSPVCYALIRKYEGFSATAYRCPAGYWTIGFGHLTHAAQGSISAAQAQQWLVEDVEQAAKAVRKLISQPLHQHQFDALVSFTFNLGSGALQRSTLRRLVNQARHDEVPEQFLRWVYAGAQKLPGLIRRRTEEAKIYQGLCVG